MDISKLLGRLANLYYDVLLSRTTLGGRVAPIHKEYSATTSTSYFALKHIFRNVSIDDRDIIVDVGCGKGRVLSYLLYLNSNYRIEGFECNTTVAAQLAKKMRRFPNVTIHAGDIFDQFPYHGTLFYLYNPFKRPVMERFKSCVDQIDQHQSLRIIYYFPLHIEVFAQDERYVIEAFQPTKRQIHRYALIERNRA